MEIASRLFTVAAALVLPVAAGVWLALRRRGYLKPVLLGALTFFVFQIMTRIPLLQLIVAKTAWYSMLAVTSPALFALLLGSTAALFEEGGRYIVMSLLMKDKRRVADGIAFGVGHGGLEAVLLVGVGAAALFFTGGASASSLDIFFGGLERISAMACHVAWSVMVLKGVAQGRPAWVLLAFALHTALDAAAVMMGSLGMPTAAIEAVAGAFALAMIAYVVFEYRKFKGGEIK